MTTRSMLLGACAALLACGAAAAPGADAAGGLSIRQYDLRLSVSMKSTFRFAVDPKGCNGIKPSGYVGSGQEILEASSPRPVRVEVAASGGGQLGLSRKDLRPGFELEGTTRRSGSMRHQVCDAQPALKFAECTGTHRFSTRVDFTLQPGDRFGVSDTMARQTRDVVPACDDTAFDWDGAVGRTGVVLLNGVRGSASKARRTRSSFTLSASDAVTCDVQFFGTGTCGTTWTWKAKFTPVKGKRRRR